MSPDNSVTVSEDIEYTLPCHIIVFMTSTGMSLDHIFTLASSPPDDGSEKGFPAEMKKRDSQLEKEMENILA